LFLAGDVMTGRGIDQVLPHPSDPRLFEGYVKSATGYVDIAERANGPIARPVDFDYVWGDALAELDRRRPAARLINLETAVTTSDDAQAKGINYRMHPGNAAVISAAGIDCCVLANNHVLDWGEAGLLETLRTLEDMNIATAGAGRDAAVAARPALLPVAGGRVVAMAFGLSSAGVPAAWQAGRRNPGVNYVRALDPEAVRDVAETLGGIKRPGDTVVVSMHWGGNWGYEIPEPQREFAHALIDKAGVDIVWGHSSHHPKAIEVHNDRLVIYGCGDFLNDYEGIRSQAQYRGDLVLMYLPTVDPLDGSLQGLAMVPFRISRFRLQRASPEETQWLGDMLTREGETFHTQAAIDADNTLVLEWDEAAC